MRDFLFSLAVGLFIFFCLMWADHRGYERAKHKFCTHGESSITATKINGVFVQSKPTRTGC